MEFSLPKELIEEIMARCSMETLGRWRAVSKESKRITYESYFNTLHHQQMKITSGFLLQSFYHDLHTFLSSYEKKINFSLDFLPWLTPRILATAPYGLVLCECRALRINNNGTQFLDRIYCLCKPFSREYKQIPSPGPHESTEYTAMTVVRSNPLQIKIVHLSDYVDCHRPVRKNPGAKRFRCRVFNSETWRWNKLADVILPRSMYFPSRQSAVSAGGAYYWMLSHNHLFEFRFDILKGRKLLQMPNSVKDKLIQLTEYEGKLGLMCMLESETMELWIMENKSWQMKYRFTDLPLSVDSPVAFLNSEIALMNTEYGFQYYNFKQKCYEQMIDEDDYHTDPIIFPFWSDFESCPLLGRRKRSQITTI